MTNSNILHRGIVSRTGSNDREAYHVGYAQGSLHSVNGSREQPLRFGCNDLKDCVGLQTVYRCVGLQGGPAMTSLP